MATHLILSCLATSAPDLSYIGSDHVLLYLPASGEYWLQRYCRAAPWPCSGIAGEPVFAGSVGLKWQRFVPLGDGALLQLDTMRGSFLVRQCGGQERLRLGLRAACPVVLEAPPQRTFSNVSILALGGDVVLLLNASRPTASNIRAVRFRRSAVLAGELQAFERLALSGLVLRDTFARHELTPLGRGLVLDYETEPPSQFRVWRLNPRCATGSQCNTASDPPLQGPLAEGQFPHPHRRYMGLSTDDTTPGSVVHVMEIDAASSSYRLLVCDASKFSLHGPLPCSYRLSSPTPYFPRPPQRVGD